MIVGIIVLLIILLALAILNNKKNMYLSDFTPLVYSTNIDKNIYNIGASYASKQKVVICGLARDIAKNIDRLKVVLERLGSYFLQYKIIIVENDSNDESRPMLLEWSKKNPNVIILGCGVNVKECKLSLKSYSSFDAGANRIGKMAYLRNIYLNYIKTYLSQYDYTIVMDIDILGSCYLDGIMNSFYHFSLNDTIDALGANGIDMLGRYYDPFALVELGKSLEYKTMEEKVAHDVYVASTYNMKLGDPLFKVRSCFAGLVIYRTRSVLNRSYSYSNKNFACEHVFFNDGLNIYINPSMIFSIIFH